MIDRETVERIKDAADIVDVVSDYVHLVRRGSNYMGLCPFHNERTPSFSVNKRKNICFCFSCKQGGSPVNFIMKKEGLSYHDALLHLAKKYGIEVKEKEMTDEERRHQSEREAMLVANEWAMHKMESMLHDTEEGQDVGLSYLYQRGVTEEAVKAFHLGYSLDKGNELTSSAKIAGYDIEVLKRLGLTGTSASGREYDRFHGRVIFPIMNSAGKVIAFGGRDLKGGLAKYINSPESDLYKKSNELYGIYQARASIIKENKCYLVEGYLDVIGMWQSGLKNTVASSGTALTDGQIALIHRFSDNITLIYDGDEAGIKASLRGVDMLLRHNMKVKVLLLPDGDDPDSFAKKHTPAELQEYINSNETDILQFKARVLLKDIQHDPQKKIHALNDMVTSIANISDQISRDIYIAECSRLMDIAPETILKAVNIKRAELLQLLRSERYKKEIEINNTPSGGKINVLPGENKINPESNIEKDEIRNIHEIPQDFNKCNPLQPIEKKIVEYCVKYGFIPFCHRNDDSDEMMNVLEFVTEELGDDGLEITTPLYKKIITLLQELSGKYKESAETYKIKIESIIDKEREEGINDIASKNLSVSMIHRAEKELEMRLAQYSEKLWLDFARDFPSLQLASHEDDLIRETVNEMILEPYQLSNIYYRDNNVVESEQDRLSILVPRALTELKNEIVNIQVKDLQQQLDEASKKGDTALEMELLSKISSRIYMRSQMAKNLGERIVSPKN